MKINNIIKVVNKQSTFYNCLGKVTNIYYFTKSKETVIQTNIASCSYFYEDSLKEATPREELLYYMHGQEILQRT